MLTRKPNASVYLYSQQKLINMDMCLSYTNENGPFRSFPSLYEAEMESHTKKTCERSGRVAPKYICQMDENRSKWEKVNKLCQVYRTFNR